MDCHLFLFKHVTIKEDHTAHIISEKRMEETETTINLAIILLSRIFVLRVIGIGTVIKTVVVLHIERCTTLQQLRGGINALVVVSPKFHQYYVGNPVVEQFLVCLAQFQRFRPETASIGLKCLR